MYSFPYKTTGLLTYTAKVNDVATSADSITVQVVKPDGSNLWDDAKVPTNTGTGTYTQAITNLEAATAGQFRALWTWTSGDSTTEDEEIFFIDIENAVPVNAYCSLKEVRALNSKRTYSESTTPTTAQIFDLIETIANEINMVLANRGYTVPVATPDLTVAYLKMVNALGAAAKAEESMFPEKSGQGETPHGAALWSQYESRLKYIRDNGLETVTTTSGLASSYQVANSTADDVSPKITKGMKF